MFFYLTKTDKKLFIFCTEYSKNKKVSILRSNYGLMVFQLFISFACGVVLGLKGTVRTVKNFLDILGEITSSKTCLYQVCENFYNSIYL